MCSAAALPKFIKVQSDVRQFSIGSKWLYEADSRFDAAAYSEGAWLYRISYANVRREHFKNNLGS